MIRITPPAQQMLLVSAGVAIAVWNILVAILVGLLWLLPIVIAIELGESRDRTGWKWGLFLGWLGVLILAIMRPRPSEVVVVDRKPWG